jgi:isocitrate dehydrogenase (NAD+)
MSRHTITLIPGDGIGPEITEITQKIIQAAGVEIDWDIQPAGLPAIEEYQTPLPEKTIDSIEKHRVCLKAPITTPIGSGYRSVNVTLRQHFDLYACVRPFKTFVGTKTRYPSIDLVVVRENIEDLYAGIETPKDAPETLQLIDFISEKLGKTVRKDSGISIKPISIRNSERIVTWAFEYAKKYRRKKVTAIHKANIMKFTDGLFLEVAKTVASRYPEVEFEDRIVDNMAMQLVQKPELYDILVCPNLYGDILSDLCAGLIGGLGMSPGGNIGDNAAIFEATHGSAPKYAGQDKVNPSALILAAVLMLRHIKEEKAANAIEEALAAVIAEGHYVTYDLKQAGEIPAKSSEMGEAIIAALKKV